MSEPTTVTTAPISPASPPNVPAKQHRSFLRRVLAHITELRLNPPKSNLAREVSKPTKTTTQIGDLAPLCHPSKMRDYASYVGYCISVGVEPRNVEAWDRLSTLPALRKDLPTAASRKMYNAAWRPFHKFVKALTPSDKEKVLPFKSRWCPDCKEYVEQSHKHQHPADAHLKQWRYYTTAIEVTKAKQWLEFVDKPLREQARVQRVAGFYERYRLLFRNNLRLSQRAAGMKHRTLAAASHKVFWVESFGGLFEHMMRRMTSVADRIVVVSQSELDAMVPLNAWLPPSKPYAVDHLSWVNPRTCKHLRAKSFTFSTGETKTSCPDCTEFDEVRQNKRHNVLRKTNFTIQPSAEVVKNWNVRLEAEGLSEGRAAFHPSLCWGDFDGLADADDLEGNESFNSGARVNTAGCTGTDGEGKKGVFDSSARDRRANELLKQNAERESLTKSFCLWCDETIWDRKGTNFCPDTDCRQRFQEELPLLNKELLEEAQHDSMVMDLYLAVNKNRKATK